MKIMLLKIVTLLLLSIILNGCDKPVNSMSNIDLLKKLKGKQDLLVVLDVRSKQEYTSGHVPGAINIPHDQLKVRIGELRSRDNFEFVVYCESGLRAEKAESILQSAGFIQITHLQGDMKQWRNDRLPIEK